MSLCKSRIRLKNTAARFRFEPLTHNAIHAFPRFLSALAIKSFKLVHFFLFAPVKIAAS
jgi:hypothetical protein